MAVPPGPKRKIAKNQAAVVETRDAAPSCDNYKGRKPAAGNVAPSAPGGEAGELGLDEAIKNRGIPRAAAAASASGGFETKEVRGGVQATAAASSDSGGLSTKKPREDVQTAVVGSDSGGPKAKKLHEGEQDATDLSRKKKTEERAEEDPAASSSAGDKESKKLMFKAFVESCGTSGKVVEGNGKKALEEAAVPNSWAYFIWKIILRRWVQLQCEPEVPTHNPLPPPFYVVSWSS